MSEAVERLKHNMSEFLKSNAERAERIRHPADDCPMVHKKKE